VARHSEERFDVPVLSLTTVWGLMMIRSTSARSLGHGEDRHRQTAPPRNLLVSGKLSQARLR